MYEDFYGLKSKPFQLIPDPKFYFGSKQHSRAKAYLEYGVSRNEGFVGDKVPSAYGDASDRPLASFDSDTFSARLGGPIVDLERRGLALEPRHPPRRIYRYRTPNRGG